VKNRKQSDLHRHIVIENVAPNVDGGRFAAKSVAGEPCSVTAHVYRDGPHVLRAVVRWRPKGKGTFREAPMTHVGNDEWSGEFPLERVGRYEFRVDAWTDALATWQGWIRRKAEAGEDLRSDLLEGAALAAGLRNDANAKDVRLLEELIATLRSPGKDATVAAARALDPSTTELFSRLDPRADVASSAVLEIAVDPRRAQFSAWYEMFPRSQGTDPTRGSTFREAERRLPDIRAMGFDVLYLPPIHPIGVTNRKGRNNALVAGADDPGSPWQIGSAAGGHTAVEPALGTLDDFANFLGAARAHGLEIALDFAIQCSPDHPWVKEHPEWFAHRPDGTIKYAENPPKKYQDIYPIDFDTTDEKGLWEELLGVVLFWIENGVRIFRVDNPHTKPIRFWAWLLEQVGRTHPGVIFLSEAFTRPKMMKMLAKVGFSQSYTYFTWRNTKHELTEYLTELTQSDMKDYFRPNFFANTPDILPVILQKGGRPAFQQRLVLAATLSPSYGIYSGYELCEGDAVAGTEEYLDSEKYQIKVRDWNGPGNIKELVTRLNAVRQENPALQQLANLRFLETDNDQLLAYAKTSADRSNVILVVVNLDPSHAHHGTVCLSPEAIGMTSEGVAAGFEVEDLLTGDRYTWFERNYVRLDPQVTAPAHVFRVEVV